MGELRAVGSAPSKPPSYPVTAWPGSGVAAKLKLKPLLLGPEGLAVTVGASIAAAGETATAAPTARATRLSAKPRDLPENRVIAPEPPIGRRVT